MFTGDIVLMIDGKVVGLAKVELDGLSQEGLGPQDVGKHQDRFRPKPSLLDVGGEEIGRVWIADGRCRGGLQIAGRCWIPRSSGDAERSSSSFSRCRGVGNHPVGVRRSADGRLDGPVGEVGAAPTASGGDVALHLLDGDGLGGPGGCGCTFGGGAAGGHCCRRHSRRSRTCCCCIVPRCATS